ncbi:MAG: DUF4037 domain-containing protein [Thermomicrobiales bacterium]
MPGLQLSEALYREAVAPLLAREFPGIAYAAARIGGGSEVLGFDTARSMDHEWGPRFHLFLDEEDVARYGGAITERLRHALPREIAGVPVNFGPTHEAGTDALRPIVAGPVSHKIEISTLAAFLDDHLGITTVDDLDLLDWLTFSEQALLEITAGAVWHDDSGALTGMRERLTYYPRDLWLYLLAAQWMRISQQEPFVGRSGEVGDEIGSATIAAALVRDVMRLVFLMERRYAPYSKWFGTAFARLPAAPHFAPHLAGALAAGSWQERELHLVRAYEAAAAMHNTLAITPTLPATASRFHSRPFLVIHAEQFAETITAQIAEPRIRALPLGVGSVDQFVDATDVLAHPSRRRALRSVYRHHAASA